MIPCQPLRALLPDATKDVALLEPGIDADLLEALRRSPDFADCPRGTLTLRTVELGGLLYIFEDEANEQRRIGLAPPCGARTSDP